MLQFICCHTVAKHKDLEMGNSFDKIQKATFEDIQQLLPDHNMLLINTLDLGKQTCLIKGTLPADREEVVINEHVQGYRDKQVRVVIYGLNATDCSVVRKYEQLRRLGFHNVMVYMGGMFEWVLLQDIYGRELFPTTSQVTDLLAFKGKPGLRPKMLTYRES